MHAYCLQLLWIYPLYAISFILNAIFYQDIADHSFITHGGTAPLGTPGAAAAAAAAASAKSGVTFQKWVATMSDEVYRLLLVTAFMIQITVLSFIPYIGTPLVVVHLCWLYSLYSFESVRRHTSAKRSCAMPAVTGSRDDSLFTLRLSS